MNRSVVRVGVAVVVGLLLVGCGDPSSPAMPLAAPSSLSAAAATTSTTAAYPSATTGDTSGRAVVWETIRIVGPSALDIATQGCAGAVGATAVITDRIVVTAFARRDDGPQNGVARPPSAAVGCGGPSRSILRLDLPLPVGDRPVVDGAHDGTASQAVAWSKRKVAGSRVNLRFPDPTCAHVARVTTVESPASVTLTAFVLPDPGTGCAGRSDPFRDYEVTLAATLGKRPLLDGRCSYVNPCT
jgi:hypothetical protein